MISSQHSIEFILELGRALHRYGSPAHRLEGALAGMGHVLGFEIQTLSTPTSISVSFGSLVEQQGFLIRVEPGQHNLGKLEKINRLVEQVRSGGILPDAGVEAIRMIEAAPNSPPAIFTTLAFPAIGVGSAVILGGGYSDMVVTAISGFVTGLLALFLPRWAAGGRHFELMGALMVGGIAHAASVFYPGVSYHTSMLAGLISLVPGLTLTIAMTEIATRNLVSGTARLLGAGVVFVEIVFGIAISEHTLNYWIGQPPVVIATMLPMWMEVPALIIACLGAGALYRANPKGYPLVVLTAIVAYYSSRLGALTFSAELGACAGGFVAASVSNIHARLRHRSVMVNLIPSLLMLLPGSLGFHSLTSLWEEDVVGGISSAFHMVFVAISLVIGLLVANSVITPRRSL